MQLTKRLISEDPCQRIKSQKLAIIIRKIRDDNQRQRDVLLKGRDGVLSFIVPRFAAQVDKLRFKGFIINGYINRVLDNGRLLLSLASTIEFMVVNYYSFKLFPRF